MRLPDANSSAIGLLRVLLAASVILPVLLFAAVTWFGYRATVIQACSDLERSAEVAAEHAEKVFDSQVQLEDRVADLIAGLDEDQIRAQEKPLHDKLNALVARLPHAASVMVAARDGRPLVSAGTYPVPTDVDLHGRDYFDTVIGGDKDTFISKLQVGDVYKQPFFGVARPWTDADGRLQGVIDLAASPAFFMDLYDVLMGEGSGGTQGRVVTLVRDDGQVILRDPPLAGDQPRLPVAGPFQAAIHGAPLSGWYKAPSLTDAGAPVRLFAYYRVRGYPLYVVAGRSESAILAPWLRNTEWRALLGTAGTFVLLAVTWTALLRTRREAAALARATREIGRRERAEDALLRAQRLEAVGQMTGGVAHDFNNLLTVITGNAGLIVRRADDPAVVRKLAQNVELAARRGAEITQHLLSFAGRQAIRPETIDLNRRLMAFKPLLERAATQAVRVVLDLSADLPAVSVDPGQFESAILNLVGNARDAMADGGSVTIRTGYAGGDRTRVRVAVTDTGAGMDRDTAARAFEPFFTTKGVGKGTGLGLSQVYGFVRQAGGDVRIASVPGLGTTIEILLPPSATVPPVEPPEAAAAEPVRDAKVVLVVEDEPHVLEVAVDTLRDLGYVTVAAADGHAALRRLEAAEPFDVLFTDMVMPGGLNGLQLSHEARRLRPDIKVLLTSGYTGISGRDLPADIPLLPKPYNRDQLSAGLTATLAR